jgi:hypothetical protein
LRRVVVVAVAALAVALTVGSTAISSPGPSHVDRRLPRGTIRWLFRHEPRGQSLAAAHIPLGALTASHWQSVRFARVLHPDPRNDIRVAVSLIGKRGRNVCITVFLKRAVSGACAVGLVLSPTNGIETVLGGSAFLAGLASDSVARMVMFLARGARRPVALKDNAYAVHLRASALPGKLVAYDSQGRVIGISPLRQAVNLR